MTGSRTPAADPAGDTRRGRAAVQINVAATTLIGLDDAPAELLGYGPIPADVARRLAIDATWRRVLVDPVTGVAAAVDPRRLQPGATPLVEAPAPDPPPPEPLPPEPPPPEPIPSEPCPPDGCDRPAHLPGDYRPGAALTRLITLRHPRCCAPGCSRAAAGCDLDHVVRYPQGPTCACNLRPLCRRHHRMKHETAWTYRVLPGGAVRWTTPTGSEHDVEPEPLLPRPRVAPVPRDLGPPPF